MITFISTTIGLAIALNVFLFVLTKLFGKGGEGTFGDIRTAIGSSLPAPLSLAIWAIALTLTAQKIIENFGWTPFEIQSGEETFTIDSALTMSRIGLLIITGTWFIARSIRAFSKILNNWHDNKDNVNLDTTAIQALASVGVVVTWVVGFIVTLQALGINMSAVITIGGISGAGVAFASKDVVANFFGGIVVMLNRPFKVGDHIVSGKIDGTVIRIGLYATHLQTETGDSLYVPNSIFNSSEIITKQ